MRRNASPERHPLVQIRRGRDPEEAVQVRRRGALVGAHQSRRLLVRRAHVQLLEHRLSLMPRQVAVGTVLDQRGSRSWPFIGYFCALSRSRRRRRGVQFRTLNYRLGARPKLLGGAFWLNF